MVRRALAGLGALCVCAISSVGHPSVAAAGASSPFGAGPAAVPGTIAAADFDNGGEGVAYHDTTPGNSGGEYRNTDVDIAQSSEGGYVVGWTADGEWLNYTVNVAAPAAYTIRVRVATPLDAGAFHVSFGSVSTPVVAVPNTGDWQVYTTVTVPVVMNLSAGPQVMRFVIDAGGFNVSGISVGPALQQGIISVGAGGDFQAALNNAQPGDTILLAPGATFLGNFVLPQKGGSGVITIRSAAPDSALPDARTLLDPSVYAALLPRIQSPNSAPALATAPGAHHYTLLFLELRGSALGYYDILTLGDGSADQNALSMVPHDLIVDRCYLHGDPITGSKRAIALNSASTTITNSYIADIRSDGQDSQAIAGWNGPGPYTITNNYLEAASQNIMFGGADPSIPNLIPSNIVIRHNRLTKQLAWQADGWWNVKNLLELKSAQQVTIDGNVFEYNWPEAQTGYAVLFTPRNQDGTCPWCTVQQVDFTNNLVRHVSSGINILGTDDLNPSGTATGIRIVNNLFEDVSGANWGGDGRFLLIGSGPVDVTIDHNTVLQDGWSVILAYGMSSTGFEFTNNIVPDYSWAVIGDSTAPGNSSIGPYFPGSSFRDNVFAGGDPGTYPAGNYYPASLSDVGFANLAGGNYRLLPSSPYHLGAIDGSDVGCNIDAMNTMAGTSY